MKIVYVPVFLLARSIYMYIKCIVCIAEVEKTP